MNPCDTLSFLTVIANRKQTDALLFALPESGAHLLHTTYAHGSVSVGTLPSVLGFVPEKEKAIITCLLTHEKSEAVFHLLTEKFHFGQPNTGIAFTMPVEQLSY